MSGMEKSIIKINLGGILMGNLTQSIIKIDEGITEINQLSEKLHEYNKREVNHIDMLLQAIHDPRSINDIMSDIQESVKSKSTYYKQALEKLRGEFI